MNVKVETKQVQVFDTLAPIGKPRCHEFIVGRDTDGSPMIKPFELHSDKPTLMPYEVAMVLLKDKAFVVLDENDKRIEPIPVEKDGGLGGLVLKPGETIAHFSELSREALFKRCKVLPGADVITEKSKPEQMVQFLVEKTTVKQAKAKDDGETLSISQLDQMMGTLEPA